MATQQVIIAETVAAMKKALKRKAYESDSDDSIDHYGNRGHKLQKTARFSHRGQLAPSQGPHSYKETIDYAGVRRDIISRNPILIDDDGYEVETDDDDERVQEAMADAAGLNPYANVRLEHILAPLTAVTDLPNHPTLSRPFTSRTLTELAGQGAELMRKENQSLWRVKHLLTALSGDYTWVPCDQMLGPNDIALYSDDHVLRNLLHAGKTSTIAGELEGRSPATTPSGGAKSDGGASGMNGTANAPPDSAAELENEDPDVTMEDPEASTARPELAKSKELDNGAAEKAKAPATVAEEPDGSAEKPSQNGSDSTETVKEPTDGGSEKGKSSKSAGKEPAVADGADGTPDQDTGLVPKTEPDAGAAAAEQNGVLVTAKAPSLSSEAIDELFIHPFFIPPSSARPDRDIGLPEQEAEDIRRLLALYVQKQEEVCRGAQRLFEGLLRADRLRKTVFGWAKAEAHCGPNRDLLDGEDWYDKEEWGLVDDLKKGQDEEEEDTGTTAKKTRNRR